MGPANKKGVYLKLAYNLINLLCFLFLYCDSSLALQGLLTEVFVCNVYPVGGTEDILVKVFIFSDR